jgi:hypothetical protein
MDGGERKVYFGFALTVRFERTYALTGRFGGVVVLENTNASRCIGSVWWLMKVDVGRKKRHGWRGCYASQRLSAEQRWSLDIGLPLASWAI